jgi:hypothetical protein
VLIFFSPDGFEIPMIEKTVFGNGDVEVRFDQEKNLML